jgi:hypothetical protein
MTFHVPVTNCRSLAMSSLLKALIWGRIVVVTRSTYSSIPTWPGSKRNGLINNYTLLSQRTETDNLNTESKTPLPATDVEGVTKEERKQHESDKAVQDPIILRQIKAVAAASPQACRPAMTRVWGPRCHRRRRRRGLGRGLTFGAGVSGEGDRDGDLAATDPCDGVRTRSVARRNCGRACPAVAARPSRPPLSVGELSKGKSKSESCGLLAFAVPSPDHRGCPGAADGRTNSSRSDGGGGSSVGTKERNCCLLFSG